RRHTRCSGDWSSDVCSSDLRHDGEDRGPVKGATMLEAKAWPATEIHPTSIIDPSAEIGSDVVIGPYSVIGPNVVIGDGTRLGPQERKSVGQGRRRGRGTLAD